MAVPQLPSSNSQLPIFLAGPTAVGKSTIALALAEKIGGEIITVDSMQAYRGLDIGTAKPTAEERRRVSHHLLDVCNLNEAFDAAQFVQLAQTAVAEIQSRGRTPIFCGGTGLYFKAFLEGVGEAPPGDAKLRAELEAAPLEKLLEELHERDLVAFEKIDRQNPRRVVRALEVIRLTEKKFSDQRSWWGKTSGEPKFCSVGPVARPDRRTAPTLHQSQSPFFCFTRPAENLHRRINIRVDEMFSSGLVDETRELLKCGLAENKFAMQAIGYRQVVEHLRGERGLAETVELVKIKTRQFAKRQLTWFRRHGNCEWIELPPDEAAAATLTKLGY
ncbi:MAG TPA: tRNA (adenosine(37)-N6)-dimethylallyltransferase MiaA [Verrucomicrobiae bacterium]|jgi:tRNA dimethylallyltransferase